MNKILCLSRAPLDYIGGIPAYCINLYGDNNFNVDVHSYDLSKDIRRRSNRKNNGINEVIHPSQIVFGTFAFSWSYLLFLFNSTSKYSYLHIQHPDPLSAIGAIIAKIRNNHIKIVITWHAEIYKNYKLFSPILIIIDLILFFISYRLIYFTPYHIKDSLLAKIPYVRNKIQRIPNCIKKPRLKLDILTKNKLVELRSKTEIKLLSIGRLVKYKGYEYSIRSLIDLDDKVKYTIIGDGPYKNYLINLINNLKLQNRVFITGKVSEDSKERHLIESDLFLFPSINKSEAYGLVQLEAMYFGLPIINTELNNGVNYLASEDVAITCKIKNTNSITSAINTLIDDPKLYAEKSANSIENTKKYSIDVMVNSYKKLFI